MENNFNEIAPMSLIYDERYNVTNEKLQNEITTAIHEFYFGYDSIDESDDSRLKVVDVSSNNHINWNNICNTDYKTLYFDSIKINKYPK